MLRPSYCKVSKSLLRLVIDLKVIEHLKKKYLDTGIRQFLFGALNLSCAILLHLHFDKTVAPLKIAFYQYVSEQNYIIPNRTQCILWTGCPRNSSESI